MKRLIIPSIIGLAFFGLMAIPKVVLSLAYLEEAGWLYAKPFFVRILVDFLFAWVVSLVVWLQLERRPWIALMAFAFATILVSSFWISSVKNAPRSFRQEMAFIYEYLEAEPLRALPRIPQALTKREEPPAPPVPVATEVPEEETESVGPEKQVEQTFYAVLRALKKYEQDTVLALADKRTWDYFSEIKELALTAERAVLEKLKPIDRFQVLALRHLKDAKALTGMTEKKLFEQAIIQGWFYIGDKPDVRIDFIDLLPGGKEAEADIIVNSMIPDERLEFIQEQGIWKMNLLQLLPRQEENMLTALHERGQSEEEFFENFLKQETGRDPSPAIWEPLITPAEQG
jgi:hypothetical protein